MDNAISSFNMSEAIELFEKIFELLNTSYYDGKLPRPVITVQSTPKAYGHCTTKKVWTAGGDNAQYEINLGAETLNRPLKNIAATLQHEMVHLFCLEAGIEDTCQNSRYHNKRFKIEAEIRDLIIGYNRTIGYSLTTPGPGLIDLLNDNGLDVELTLSARNTQQAVKAKRPQKKVYKYICPICGVTVKSTAPVNIRCLDCMCNMEL